MGSDWDEVRIGASMADMKEVEYRNTLAIASLIDLLIEKGIVDARELARRSAELDRESAPAARQALR